MQSATLAAATLNGVVKRYGAVPALDGVTLSIDRGEVTALLGPNGAGKSTAIGLLLGLISPDAGSVELFGESPHRLCARRRIRCVTSVTAAEVREWAGVNLVTAHEGRLSIEAVTAEPIVRRLLAVDPLLREIEVTRAGLAEAFVQITKEAA